MAEITSRPERVRQVRVSTPAGTREGSDLNDVLRQIIFDMKQANGWSTAQTAENLGMSQQTLYSFMEQDSVGAEDEKGRGMSVRSLSKIIAARGTNPVLFFVSHPLYRSRSPLSIPIDAYSYESLNALLSPQLAKDLAKIVEVFATRGTLEDFISTQKRNFGIADDKPRARRTSNKKSS